MKRGTLLSVIGPCTFKLLRNLLTPDKQGDKSYAELVKRLTGHFSPKPSEIVQRLNFTAIQGSQASPYKCLRQNCMQLLNIAISGHC